MKPVAIHHPGPAAAAPFHLVRGDAKPQTLRLSGGANLMREVAKAMDRAGADSGVIVLDGLKMGPYRYVMPDVSRDGIHAAWYSDPHDGSIAAIDQGTAIVGRRDGAWWLHAHASWTDGTKGASAGHLLPDDVTLAEACNVTLFTFQGGRFDVALNAETQFSIFHPIGGQATGNALIAKVNPHHDISEMILTMARQAGFHRGRVLGLGSLIGARFTDGAQPMTSLISEVLVLRGAGFDGDQLNLPMFCVDPENAQFQGPLAAGTSPVCVTFELMIIADRD